MFLSAAALRSKICHPCIFPASKTAGRFFKSPVASSAFLSLYFWQRKNRNAAEDTWYASYVLNGLNMSDAESLRDPNLPTSLAAALTFSPANRTRWRSTSSISEQLHEDARCFRRQREPDRGEEECGSCSLFCCCSHSVTRHSKPLARAKSVATLLWLFLSLTSSHSR